MQRICFIFSFFFFIKILRNGQSILPRDMTANEDHNEFAYHIYEEVRELQSNYNTLNEVVT